MKQFKVISTKLITSNTLLLSLKPKSRRDVIDYYPGQYAAIGFRYKGRPSPMRSFSIVSSPSNEDILQFATRINGEFTTSLSELESGDSMFVQGPFGNFVIDESQDKNVILIAAGIGITPFMSMIKDASETKLNIPIVLLYSNPSQENVPFYNEITELDRKNPKFKSAFFITNGPADKLADGRILKGRINEERLDQITAGNYQNFTFFICGPKGFTSSMKSILENNNTDPSKIITEEFTPASQVNSISILPKHSVYRWTYAFTGMTLVLATAFFMAIDLVRAVPKLVSANAAIQRPLTSQTSGSSTSSTNGSNTTSTSSGGSQTGSTTSGNSVSNSTSSSTPNQTYQAPITSVS
jgi:ferredoxin-NADP reductase